MDKGAELSYKVYAFFCEQFILLFSFIFMCSIIFFIGYLEISHERERKMKKKILPKLTAGLLMLLALVADLQSPSELTIQAQAQENTQRAGKETADLSFLTYCDLEELKSITVTESQAAELMQVVNKETAGIKSDYDKAGYLYSWMIQNIKYESNPYVQISAEAYDVFVNKYGVCGGFSNLYNELLHLAGIPSVAVTGYYNPYGHGNGYDDYNMAHQWNAVYADGKWFYVDTTGAGFDAENIWNTHKVTEVYDAILEKDGLLIGYYYGTAVIGTKEPMKTVTIPDTYEDMKITAISYQLFGSENGMEVLNIGSNVNYMAESSAVSSQILKQINVSEKNTKYASRDGVLFTKDMKELLAYPKACDAKIFTLPKDTQKLDMKDAFANANLTAIEVEEGNASYASYDGALYDADMKELLFVPAGKTSVRIPENATISDMAFANSDRENMTIYGTPGSYAETFAGWYNMRFVDINEWVEPPVEEENEVVRLFGAGRYETGYAVADALKAALGVEKFEAVVVATGTNFADALAGSYLAVEKNAPILLTNGKDANVAELHVYIKANVAKGGMIYILGGEAAVPASVEEIDNYKVVRLSGASRYDTNLAILEEAGITGDSIIVATGKTFADSLSASAAKLPILLVKPNTALNDAQANILGSMKNIYIVGGESAVSAACEAELKEFGKVTRVFGDSRYDTSVEVAKIFCKDVTKAVVASGKNFPDGLCGGPLAAALDAPLVLTKDGGADAAAGYVSDNAIVSGYVLGGEGALADETVVEVFNLENAEEIYKQ